MMIDFDPETLSCGGLRNVIKNSKDIHYLCPFSMFHTVGIYKLEICSAPCSRGAVKR